MADFLLELASEEIPARMQAAAAEQLRTRVTDGLKGRVAFDRIDDTIGAFTEKMFLSAPPPKA